MKRELIEKLFQAFGEGDREKFLQAANEVIKDEERKSHHHKSALLIPRDTEKGFPLLA